MAAGCSDLPGDAGADNIAPTPSPLTWVTEPVATGKTTIEMMAEEATDNLGWPVQYYFECAEDASASSGWQTDTYYEATGLEASTLADPSTYTFRVRASDGADTGRNNTAWSTSLSATTDLETGWIDGYTSTGYDHPAPAGTNRVLLVFCHGVARGIPPDFTAVTYGGQDLTLAVEHRQNQDDAYSSTSETWYLDEAGIAAASGSAIAVTNDPADELKAGVALMMSSIFYGGVDQADPIGETGGHGLNPNDFQTLTVTLGGAAAGDVLVGNCTSRGNANWNQFAWATGMDKLGEELASLLNSVADTNLYFSAGQLVADAADETVSVDITKNGVGALAVFVLNNDGTNDTTTIYD